VAVSYLNRDVRLHTRSPPRIHSISTHNKISRSLPTFAYIRAILATARTQDRLVA